MKTLFIKPELHSQLKNIALGDGRSLGWHTERAVENYVNRKMPKKGGQNENNGSDSARR